jgi:hypothetical protein
MVVRPTTKSQLRGRSAAGLIVLGVALAIAGLSSLWSDSGHDRRLASVADQSLGREISVDAQASPQDQGQAELRQDVLDSGADHGQGSNPHRFFRVLDGATGNSIVGASASCVSIRQQHRGVQSDAGGVLALPIETLPSSGQARESATPALRPVIPPIPADGFALAAVLALVVVERASGAADVALDACAELHLIILDAAGRPVANARVELYSLEHDLVATQASRDEIEQALRGGGFRTRSVGSGLTGEAAIGRLLWRGRADDVGGTHFTCLPAHIAFGATVVVDGSIAKRVALGLELQPGESKHLEWSLGAVAPVVVEIVERDGTPAEQAMVWIVRADAPDSLCQWAARALLDGESRPHAECATDPGGLARFEGIPEGRTVRYR